MSRGMTLALAALFCSSAWVAAADSELLRVFPETARPADSRLTDKYTIDNPADFKADFKTKADWERRAEFLKHQLLVAEGLWPMPERVPLNAVVHGKIDRDEYTVEKVFFTSIPGHYVSGNLYRPRNKTGKLPGVLCPHGHWKDGRFMWESDATAKKSMESGAEQWADGAHSLLQARCAMLARMGCVVFHYDMLGYADSTAMEHRKGFNDVESVLRLQSQMGLQTWNGMRSLDFLTSLPDVDPSRLAVTGASGGGTQSLILAAADDRMAVAFPAVMVGEAMQGGCVCENAPLLRIGTNNAEIVSIFAPKPLGMSAANDWTVAMETKTLPDIQQIYKLYGATDHVAGKHFPFPHNYNQVSREFMYGWFNKHLKLGWPEPVKEKPFVAIPPAQLTVYDPQHPRPADTADAATLRKLMTETSDKQLAALAKDPDAYQKMLRVALSAMLTDAMPGSENVMLGKTSGPLKIGAYVSEHGFIQRRGTGEEVPAAVLFPPNWNGTLVVWVHPDGKSSLLGSDGQPTPVVKKLLDADAAVLSADVYLTGEYTPPGHPAPIKVEDKYSGKNNQPYIAFDLGYNRSVLANRVHDILSTIALGRGWQGTKSVRIVGIGQAGPWALLARAVAGDTIDRAAIDLDGFDFDRVSGPNDEMLIPGALKYGGIYGFVPLCTRGETLLGNARKTGKYDLAAGVNGVTLRPEQVTPAELVDWVK